MNNIIISFPAFNDDWWLLQDFLKRNGNPRYELIGDVNLTNTKDIFDLGNLVRVYGDLDVGFCSVQSLGALEYVSGTLRITRSMVESLGNLEYVGGNLFMSASKITNLGKLKYVGEVLNLFYLSVESLGDLEYAGCIRLSEYHIIPEDKLMKFNYQIW